MGRKIIVVAVLSISLGGTVLLGQNQTAIRTALEATNTIKSPQEVTWKITSSHTDEQSGFTHTYTRQTLNGIPIIGTESSFHVDNKSRRSFANVTFQDQEELTMTSQFANAAPLSISELFIKIAEHFEVPTNKIVFEITQEDPQNLSATIISESIAHGDIQFNGVLFFENENELQYGYSVRINLKNTADWWEVIINAKNGEIIKKANYTKFCAPSPLTNFDRKKENTFT